MKSVFKNYITYLKNNPNNLWFKRKMYGWGWTPATWQGWFIVFGYIAIIVLMFFFREENVADDPMSGTNTLVFALPILVLTILLIVVAYKKGEKPRWQWGQPKSIDSNKTRTKKILTLCIPVQDDSVLLGMKKRGFGAGRWNGFGGKIEGEETIEQGTLRELHEEVGINTGTLKKVGILEFSFQNDDKILEVHIFKLTNFSGTPIETEEMRPQWFARDAIPFSQMWSDDEYWFPLFLNNKLFKGSFLFDRPSDANYSAKIISQQLDTVSTLD